MKKLKNFFIRFVIKFKSIRLFNKVNKRVNKKRINISVVLKSPNINKYISNL